MKKDFKKIEHNGDLPLCCDGCECEIKDKEIYFLDNFYFIFYCEDCYNSEKD